MRATFLLLLPIATLPAAAFADTRDAVAPGDDSIVVTANAAPTSLAEVGQSISVLDAGTIAARQSDFVGDLLRTLPGVAVARNGGPGGTTSVFIRGAESAQTVALIDGVKINDPSSPAGGFDFSSLLTGNIQRIELLRGAQSVLWGSDAIGGVVNVITAPPTDRLTVNARGEYGYRNTGQLVANASDTIGPVAASVGGGYFRTDGISAFDKRMGGTEKDGYRNYGANAKFVVTLSNAFSLDLRGYYSEGRAGIDGYLPPDYAFVDTAEFIKTRNLVGYGGANLALFGGRLKNRLGFAYTETRRRSFDPDGFTFETFAGNGRNERVDYQGVADLADGWNATFGAEHEASHYTMSSYGFAGAPAHARLDSGYGQLVATLVPGLTLTGGLRHDEHSRFGGATTFGGSGVWTPGRRGTTFRASYTTGFKVPTLYELYGDYGNVTLRPERSRGWDAGVTQKLLGDVVEVGATYFQRTSRNLIDFIDCPTQTGICTDRPYGTYDNVGRARAMGAEATLALHPTDAFTLTANYTRLDARNRTTGSANDGNRLARRPRDTASASADYRLAFGLALGGTVSRAGASYDDAGNFTRLKGYTLVDLRAAYPVAANLEVFGRVENLLGEHYETAFQYGSTGRAGYVGVRLRY